MLNVMSGSLAFVRACEQASPLIGLTVQFNIDNVKKNWLFTQKTKGYQHLMATVNIFKITAEANR